MHDPSADPTQLEWFACNGWARPCELELAVLTLFSWITLAVHFQERHPVRAGAGTTHPSGRRLVGAPVAGVTPARTTSSWWWSRLKCVKTQLTPRQRGSSYAGSSPRPVPNWRCLRKLSRLHHRPDTLELEADHRRHAEIENAIRDLTYGVGLISPPAASPPTPPGWQVIAHNLARWTARIGLGERLDRCGELLLLASDASPARCWTENQFSRALSAAESPATAFLTPRCGVCPLRERFWPSRVRLGTACLQLPSARRSRLPPPLASRQHPSGELSRPAPAQIRRGGQPSSTLRIPSVTSPHASLRWIWG